MRNTMNHRNRQHPRHRPVQPWVGISPSEDSCQPGLHYREFAPPVELVDFIVGVWTLAGRSRGSSPLQYHVVPDGCSDLIFNHHAGEGFTFGTVSKAKTVEMSGTVSLVGVRLQPHLLPAFTGIPAHAVRDAEPSFAEASLNGLNDLFTSHAAKTSGGCGRCGAESLARAVAKRFRPERVNRRAAWLTSALLSGGGSVDHAAQQTGFSHRQLQRIAQHDIGLAPKLFGRILRLQQSFPAVLDGGQCHALAAAEHGYADQAHMIREFTELTGYSPGFWRKRRDVRFLQSIPASRR